MPARKYTDKCNNGHPNNYVTTDKGNTYCLDCSRFKSRQTWERADKVLYMTWSSMRRRCNNPNAQNYYLYGGRGIKVCKRWDSYDNFAKDMGEKPSPSHSIERVDHEADYSPKNCVWATPLEQGNNKRNNVVLTHAGKSQTIAQWAREVSIPLKTIYNRASLGWTDEQILTIPVMRGSNQKLRAQ